MKKHTQYLPSLIFLTVAVLLSALTAFYQPVAEIFQQDLLGVYLSFALLVIVAVSVHRYAPKTPVPVYVWAIIFGIALQVPFLTLVENRSVLIFIVYVFAAFILFASGIHVPIKNFKKYFAPIAALSIIGTLCSIILFAGGMSFITTLYGLEVPALTLLILAAILSSVDPTTVIPTLEHLHFRRPFIRDIAVSESAVNDVVGIILTRFFLIAALGTLGATTLSVHGQFFTLFSYESFSIFSAEIIWGILIGLLGAWILKTWGASIGDTHWSDPALFFTVPLFCFALGSIVGGAGFLAAFIAGLLFENQQHTKEVHVFFDGLVDRLIKPIAFILLGALAPLDVLINTIAIGTLVALIFMFVIRPLVVYISLLPWMFTKKTVLHWRELLFLSFVRETGAVSAILILLTVALGVIQAEFIFAIAVWVILYTLIIEPPLTPLIAKRLEVVK